MPVGTMSGTSEETSMGFKLSRPPGGAAVLVEETSKKGHYAEAACEAGPATPEEPSREAGPVTPEEPSREAVPVTPEEPSNESMTGSCAQHFESGHEKPTQRRDMRKIKEKSDGQGNLSDRPDVGSWKAVCRIRGSRINKAVRKTGPGLGSGKPGSWIDRIE